MNWLLSSRNGLSRKLCEMKRPTTRDTGVFLLILAVIGGCMSRGNITQRIKRSEALLEQGDQALIEKDWPTAKRCYETTNRILQSVRQASSRTGGPMGFPHFEFAEGLSPFLDHDGSAPGAVHALN